MSFKMALGLSASLWRGRGPARVGHGIPPIVGQHHNMDNMAALNSVL
jgi:hypothetical protein